MDKYEADLERQEKEAFAELQKQALEAREAAMAEDRRKVEEKEAALHVNPVFTPFTPLNTPSNSLVFESSLCFPFIKIVFVFVLTISANFLLLSA